jgi:RNA recognition motif-containing protein
VSINLLSFFLLLVSTLTFASVSDFLLKTIYFKNSMNIYVSNLSFNVQDEDLREFFAEYGEVASAKVITDKLTGKSRGFGFVEMPDDAAAQKAVAELDQATVENRTIRVVEAKPKEEKPARSFQKSNSGSFRNNRY